MRLIKPILDKPSYHVQLQKDIFSYLYENIFKEIYKILKPQKEFKNAASTMLIQYLIEGKLTYEQNKYFKGKLNATISKQLRELGAKYNNTIRAYQLEAERLPIEIKAAIAHGNIRNKEKVERVQEYLISIEGKELPPLGIELSFSKTLTDLHKQFDKTTKPLIPEDLEVPMHKRHEDGLKTEYAENLEKYIKDWHEEAVLRLRARVMDNTIAGFRAENLIKGIEEEEGVNYRKARFLAKQETSLLTSKYREIRYTENGINYYTWSTSHDERVRKRHRELNGKIFRFDHPPVVDIHHMRRANPGEDFNCRCVAIPVISDIEERRLEMHFNSKKGKIQNGILR